MPEFKLKEKKTFYTGRTRSTSIFTKLKRKIEEDIRLGKLLAGAVISTIKQRQKAPSEVTTTTVAPVPTYEAVGNILKGDMVAFDVTKFNKICDQISESICRDFITLVDNFRSTVFSGKGDGNDPPLTYEEILKRYMDLSTDATVLGYVDVATKVVQLVVKLFTGIGIPVPSVQTGGLAIIWTSMILDLETKRSCEPTADKKHDIAKICIGLMGFVTQIFNREAPIVSWIGNVYKAFAMAGDYIKESPFLYRKLFPNKFIDIKRFPDWHKKLEQFVGRNDTVTIGKAFNICYTFRVGDIYLNSVLDSRSYWSKELWHRVVDSLAPVPTEQDLLRVFDLYTKKRIYKYV